MIACGKGNKDVINVLLNAGADPNITDGVGATCIHHAVHGGCGKDVLETIMNHDADVNVTNKNNRTALMVACDKGNTDAINVLLNAGAYPTIANVYCNTCLHYACGDCCAEVLKTIFSHNADVNAGNKRNVTTSMTACKKGNIDAMNALLNAGADPNTADADGDTCLTRKV